jgi:hypothetical protein
MELLKQSEKFITYQRGADLIQYLHKLVFWIENVYAETAKRVNWNVGRLNKGNGIMGTFTTTDGKTVTVENGIVTNIT